MVNQVKKPHFHDDSCAAVNNKNTYSAEELARIYILFRADFLAMDFEVVTLNWNPNFIFDFLYHIKDIKQIELAIEWLAYAWKDKHHIEDSYDNIINKELAEKCNQFVAMLNDIKRSLIQRFENEKNKQSLMEKMLEGCNNETTTTETETTIASSETQETNSPQFIQQSSTNINDGGTSSQILIESLPEHVRNCVVVSQPIFDIFVKQLNEDAWCIVEQNKGKYSDALRFLCNFYHILSRNTTREIFNDLLHAVVDKVKNTPSLVSSLSRRSDTSTKTIDSSYKFYDSTLERHQKMVWQLKSDCKPLEESLKPVIDAINQKAAISSSLIS